MFLFSTDICGEGPRLPRHARAYGDLSALYAQVDDHELARFVESLNSD